MRLVTSLCRGLLLLTLLSGCARPGAHDSKAVRVSPEKTEAAEPAVALAQDGTVYVAWVEHRGRDADVWLAHFDVEGKPTGQPARVNPNAGEATAWRGDPPTVAVSRDGAIYVGWTARDESAATHAAITLYLSASRDGGQTFGPPSKVNDDDAARPCAHGMHSLAVGHGGRVYVAWLDERNVAAPKPAEGGPVPAHSESNRELFFASSEDGGRTFTRNLRVAGEVCPCCKTSLAVGDDGRVYAGWRQVLPGNFRHVAVASSDDGGQTFSTPTVVSDDRWELQGCPVSGPALAAAGGGLRVLWYTAGASGKPGLYWSESSDGGRTFSPRLALAESDAHGTPILLKDSGDNFKAVWESGDAKAVAAVTADLSADGRHSEPSPIAVGGTLPAAAGGAGRQVFVAYVAGEAVWLARADADERKQH